MTRTPDKTRQLNLHEMEVRAIDAVLHCPLCHMQHIDAPDGDWKRIPQCLRSRIV
jgi:hypothetical protein